MTVVSRVLQQLKRGDPVSGSMIADLINDHTIPRARMIGLFNRYKTDATQPWHTVGNTKNIFQRSFLDETKINNRINVDHFSNIVNTKTGYFVGEAITYSVDEKAANKELIEGKMREFLNRIDTVDLDTETGKIASACGYGARLCFINEDGKEDAMDIPPWECIFLSKDGSITSPDYALRYYKTTEVGPGGSKEIIKAEWYDKLNVTYWKQTTAPVPSGITQDPATPQNTGFVFGFDPDELENPRPHMFAAVPLIGFPNNEELQADPEKVLALIDAYDRTLSDVNSEIEQFRMAYLAIYGYSDVNDPKFIDALKRTGVMGFGDKDDRAEFITKTLDAVAVENHLTRLEQEIYAISGIPNLRDEAFSGNSSGVALKFKIFPMEVKCKMAQNKFAAALHQQFRIVGSKWEVEGVKFNSDDLTFKFKRNFPLNLLDEAQTAQALTGIVSQETVLSTLSIVKNVPEEMERMKTEQADKVDLDKELYGLPTTPPPGTVPATPPGAMPEDKEEDQKVAAEE